MPVYEYRCEKCEERYEEYLSTSDKPTPPCPNCGSAKVTRLLSMINTEWLPSDVAWDRVGRKWDCGCPPPHELVVERLDEVDPHGGLRRCLVHAGQ
jgi:putative FmdB family regulatory protein